jgi:hypothetical protein
MKLPPDIKLWLDECETCKCGAILRRNPYPPFDYYHVAGNQQFNHPPSVAEQPTAWQNTLYPYPCDPISSPL